jgi:hypothetical protein
LNFELLLLCHLFPIVGIVSYLHLMLNLLIIELDHTIQLIVKMLELLKLILNIIHLFLKL